MISGAMPRCVCLLNRVPCLPFRVHRGISIRATESPPGTAPRFLASSARSWQAATGEDDLSLYFPGRSSSSNKGISFFSFSFLSAVPSSCSPPSPTPSCHCLHPSGVASLVLSASFSHPYSSSTTVHLRPLATTLPVHIVFHERAEILSLSLFLSLSLSLFSSSLRFELSLPLAFPPTVIDYGNVAVVGRVTRFVL